jgi:hypothetical protein
VGGLRADKSSAAESADEEALEGEAILADNKNREVTRQAPVPPSDLQAAQSIATRFLDEYRRIDGLSYQDATGYWANSYIPGDPAMRLLQARLKAWDRSTFGSDVRLEERVQPVAQPFDAPQDAALAVYLDADAPAIDGPTRLRLQVGIKGAERQGGHRPAMNLGLLVDLRDGFDAESARRIRALIDALERARQPEDRFSLTVAGPGGGLLVAPDEFRHGPLRVAMDRMFADPKQAPAIYPDLPNTLAEVSEGVRAGDDPNAVLGSSLALLVTGSSLANDLNDLERMAHLNAVAGVPLSVVSLAAQEDLAHIDRLVAAGQGNRRILDSAQAADGVIDRELHASSRAVARALRLRIRLAPGVELVDVLGSRRLDEELAERVREAEVAIDRRLARNLGIEADRGEDEEGIQIVIPNFYAGDSHTILLDVVAQNPGPLADVTLRYKDVVYLRNGVARANLTLERRRPRQPDPRGRPADDRPPGAQRAEEPGRLGVGPAYPAGRRLPPRGQARTGLSAALFAVGSDPRPARRSARLAKRSRPHGRRGHVGGIPEDPRHAGRKRHGPARPTRGLPRLRRLPQAADRSAMTGRATLETCRPTTETVRRTGP